MKITDLIKRLTGNSTSAPTVTWNVDTEGVNFFLPEELKAGEVSSGVLSLALLQAATLRSAEEAGLAEKNYSGYTVFSRNFVKLEEDFFDLFDFPPVFLGTIDVSFDGSIGQAAFAASTIVELLDGARLRSFQLDGPFLAVSKTERYRLERPDHDGISALAEHEALPSGERTEYINGRLVHNLQKAQQEGGRLRLAHFENLSVIEPEQIGVVASMSENGDFVLSPSIPGTATETMERRWGQLSNEDVGALRAENQLVILKPEARAAVEEVLTNRRIPKEQIASFVKNPTAYINAALIDLDTGFSVRVHGAERFELRYFGETEQEVQDWFGGEPSAPVALKTLLSRITAESELDDIKERAAHAKTHGADVFEFDGAHVSVTGIENPSDVCERERPAVQARQAKKEEQGADFPPDVEYAAEELATVAIDDNDEETQITGQFDLSDFDPTQQTFDRDKLARNPFPHQEEGIRWLLAHLDRLEQYETGGALLADDMGLGKTYMTLVSIAEWMSRVEARGGKLKPHLIVAPVSLLANWKKEVELAFKRSPFKDIVILQAGESLSEFREKGAGKEVKQRFDSERIEDADAIRHSLKVGSIFGASRLDTPNRLVLTTYQTLRDYQFSMARIDWGVVALDEAQNIKNPNALVTRAAKGLKSDFRLIATGTPVENSLKDFWCLMDTCTPGLMGNWQEFRQSYIQPILESDNDPNVKQEVGRQLRERAGTFMLRRTKEGSLERLPTKTLWIGSEPGPNESYLATLDVMMPPPQLSAYNDVINGVRLSGAEDKRGVALGALQALRSVCIHPALRTNDAIVEQFSLEDSGKMRATFDVLDEVKARNEKAIIFLVNKRAQQMVAAAVQAQFGLQVDIINGDTKSSSRKVEQTRQGILDRFQAGDGFDVIIMSPVAAGVGLTVTAANNVIHLERHWNPAKEAQATDRVYRIGQQRPVNVYLPVTKHPELISFDERLNNLLRNKVDLSDAVVTTDAVSDEEMMDVFS